MRRRPHPRPLTAVALVAAGLGLAAGAAPGCGGTGDAVAPVVDSQARPLGRFSTELPQGSRDQALLALRQDAWRREHRFRNAADPGHLWAASRPTQAEIVDGRFTPEELFAIGGQIFHFRFTHEVGYGGGDLPAVGRFHTGARGGPDASRCADCHWRGGPAGAGDAADAAMLFGDGDRESTATPRNPPALPGSGWKEILAAEMTAQLQGLRADAIEFAAEKGYGVTIDLTAKGVDFGQLVVEADGSVDTQGVEGVDADLVVKPFGWKGTFETVRDVSEDALNVHHGMQSIYLAQTGATSRVGDGPDEDPDDDGVIDEVTEGQMTALSLYAAMQEVPVELPPEDSQLLVLYAQGRVDFETLGCASCHVPALTVEGSRFSLEGRLGSPSLTVDLSATGAMPRLTPDPDSGEMVLRIYSDLKRHRMGDVLAENRPAGGLPADEFITPPLWGIARSRPYLHDGRAPTIEDAIEAHGGEAEASRDAFAALDDLGRAPLRIFLASLSRQPRMVAQ